MFLEGVIPALVYGTPALAVPESPWHWVACRRTTKALAVLRRILALDDEVTLDRKLFDVSKSLQNKHKPR